MMTGTLDFLPHPRSEGGLSDPNDPICLDLVDEEQWRVLDLRYPSTSGRHVIGFVQAVAGVFEVTVLTHLDRAPEFCHTLDSVRSLFDT